MHRWTSRKQPRYLADIQLVPFMDVAFMLLFVFMLVAPLLKTDVIPAAMPVLAPKDTVLLEVIAAEQVVFNGRKLATKDLTEAVKALAVTRPGLGVIIQLAEAQPVSLFSEMATHLRLAGVEKTALQTVKTP